MSDMVTIRWADGTSITEDRNQIVEAFFDSKWSGKSLWFRCSMTAFQLITCPNTPGNRAALGLPPKENARFLHHVRADFQNAVHVVDRDGIPIPHWTCKNCRREITDRTETENCPGADQKPPAREVVELEGVKNSPVRIYRDMIKYCSLFPDGSMEVVRKMPDGSLLEIGMIDDTPRNRWVLRQAGIEVKE